jgi:hypothetical protein
MLPRAVTLLAAVAAFCSVLATTDAQAGKGDHGYVTVPWDYELPDLGGPPFLLTPNFLPWVPGCYQTRAIRTRWGWVRQRIWVCS